MKQFTIGELISELELLQAGGAPEDSLVYFDFSNFFPCDLSTWRGDYDEMALEYAPVKTTQKPFTIKSLVDLLRNSLDLFYVQYKDNDSTQPNNDTKLWVANWGELSYTTIYKVSYTRGLIYLHTYLIEE